jgi:hypothetical protein
MSEQQTEVELFAESLEQHPKHRHDLTEGFANPKNVFYVFGRESFRIKGETCFPGDFRSIFADSAEVLRASILELLDNCKAFAIRHFISYCNGVWSVRLWIQGGGE